MGYLDTPEVRKLLPRDLRYIRFAWGKPAPNSEVIDLYALSPIEMTGTTQWWVVVDAMQTYDMMGNPAVSMQMNTQGARTWENMTGKAFREATNIAIVLDDIVILHLGIQWCYFRGRSEITGNFSSTKPLTWLMYCSR